MKRHITMKQIDLSLPDYWDALSTPQMEELCRLLHSKMNVQEFKLRAFSCLTGTVLCKRATRKWLMANDNGVYYFRRRGFLPWLRRERLPLSAAHIAYAFSKMEWLLQPSDRVSPPYPYLRRWGKTFQGPMVKFIGFTWRQYKYAQDYLSLWQDDPTRRHRAMFLAVLYSGKIRYEHPSTKQAVRDFNFCTTQVAANYRRFLSFPEWKFQVVLQQWTGVSTWLKEQYPHVFSEKGESAHVDIVKAESQLTETLCARKHITSTELYNEPYTLVLEQLEQLALEAAAVEKSKVK